MNETQARTLREAHDAYVKTLNRQSRHTLACMYRVELADRSIYLAYGGPVSKDEFISALVELRYPLAKLNESIHVLYHRGDITNDACDYCGCDREVWDVDKPAVSARLTDA